MWTDIVIPVLLAGITAGTGYLATRSSARRAGDAADRATREAKAARESTHEVERLRRLDDRVREARVKVYSPMLKVLGSALSNRGGVKSATQTAKDEAQLLSVMNDFWRDALVYASDDGQRGLRHG